MDQSPYTSKITICDPCADADEVAREYGLKVIPKLPNALFDVIILAVAHTEFMALDILKYTNQNRVIYDVKGDLLRNIVDRWL